MSNVKRDNDHNLIAFYIQRSAWLSHQYVLQKTPDVKQQKGRLDCVDLLCCQTVNERKQTSFFFTSASIVDGLQSQQALWANCKIRKQLNFGALLLHRVVKLLSGPTQMEIAACLVCRGTYPGGDSSTNKHIGIHNTCFICCSSRSSTSTPTHILLRSPFAPNSRVYKITCVQNHLHTNLVQECLLTALLVVFFPLPSSSSSPASFFVLAAPSQAPVKIMWNTSNSKVILRWDQVHALENESEVTGYKVKTCRESDSDEFKVCLFFTDWNVTKNEGLDLHEYTLYLERFVLFGVFIRIPI